MIGEEPSALVQDGDELIDTSTPQSLERDFYAWLKGELFPPKSPHSSSPSLSNTPQPSNLLSLSSTAIPQTPTTPPSSTLLTLPPIEQLSLGAGLQPSQHDGRIFKQESDLLGIALNEDPDFLVDFKQDPDLLNGHSGFLNQHPGLLHSFKQEPDLLSNGHSPSSSLSSSEASPPADTPHFMSLAYSFLNAGSTAFGLMNNMLMSGGPEINQMGQVFRYDGVEAFGEKTGKEVKAESSQVSVIKKQRRVNSATLSANAHSGGGRNSGTNQLGRTYNPGLPLSMQERQRIVSLYRAGWKICDISKQLCVTHSCVSKILHRFRQTGSVKPKDAKEGRMESPLVKAIRDYRNRLGICRQSDIREQLIRDGLCRKDTAPSRSSINHILRTKLDVRLKRK